MPIPKKKHLNHLERRWIENVVNWMEKMVRKKRVTVYFTTVIVIVAAIIGVYKIKVSGSLIEDMPKTKAFYKDIKFFELIRHFFSTNINYIVTILFHFIECRQVCVRVSCFCCRVPFCEFSMN